jgi:hypothetical protein
MLLPQCLQNVLQVGDDFVMNIGLDCVLGIVSGEIGSERMKLNEQLSKLDEDRKTTY